MSVRSATDTKSTKHVGQHEEIFPTKSKPKKYREWLVAHPGHIGEDPCESLVVKEVVGTAHVEAPEQHKQPRSVPVVLVGEERRAGRDLETDRKKIMFCFFKKVVSASRAR